MDDHKWVYHVNGRLLMRGYLENAFGGYVGNACDGKRFGGYSR